MMDASGKRYSVMELAEKLSVPRTTVNDWLSKYAQFAGSELVGKRRVYTPETLAMLEKVSSLRAGGLSFQEIETELSSAFAVHPEAETVQAPESQASGDGSAAASGEGGKAPEATYAVAARKDMQDVSELIAANVKNMTDRLASLSAENARNSGRAKFFAFLFIVLLAAAGAGGYYGWKWAVAMKADAAERSRKITEQDKALSLLAEEKSVLVREAGELKNDVSAMKEDMAEQRKAFDGALKDAKENYAQTLAAEKAKMTSEFTLEKERLAAEKAELQKQLDAAKAEND